MNSTTDLATNGLRVEDVIVRFGGITAVDRLNLHAPRTMITGLIGPNGAGKTTTFNVCSGLQRPSQGRVFFDGEDITATSCSSRARRGLGRTFQRMQLFDSMTVRDNVRLGCEGSLAGVNPLRQLVARPSDTPHIRAAAEDALEICGLQGLADRRTADLSTGQRRLVELGRVLAGPFDLLLLDEPSSGLDRHETSQFGDLLVRAVREKGIGLLVVEHDMALVLSICDYLYVLDFGRLIFEGTPDEVRASDIVRAAYLGSSDLEAGLSASEEVH